MHTHIMTDADQNKAHALKNEILDLCLHRKVNTLVALSAARCAAECFESIINEQQGEVFTAGKSPAEPLQPTHPFGPCGYKYCDWPDGELRCNEPRWPNTAAPLQQESEQETPLPETPDDDSADWCDDCHGYTHKYDCPSKRSEAKTPLVDKLVNAVYRSMAQYEDGTWFLDNLKAKAQVKRLLAAPVVAADDVEGEK